LEIVGVAAPDFAILAPRISGHLTARPTTRTTANHHYQSVGKLKGDVDHARRRRCVIGDALARQYPENCFKTATVIPPQQRLTSNARRRQVFLSAVGVVWLIGRANIANLRWRTGRTREIAPAPRSAPDAPAVRQLLTESCVLASGRLVGLCWR
jgi:hypothetical protein